MDKGRGAKKRKTLARTLALAWGEACESDAHVPTVTLREVYRLMSRVMGAKDVKEELKKMAGAGLVVLEDDTVGCGRRRNSGEGGDEGSADAGSGEVAEGGRAVANKRRRERRGDSGGSGREASGDLGGDGGEAKRRRGEGGRARPVYVESEQESGDETDGEWG